jgi:arylsulfatase A-like enzyme
MRERLSRGRPFPLGPYVHLTLLLGCLAAGAPASAAEPPARRPTNVLFLLTDDQRPDTIRALGNPLIETPHLDALVQRGVVFTRAVSPNPLCVPSRAEILTGCSGFRNGVLPGHSDQLNPKLTLWPEAMRAAGYHTCYVGKWHTTGRPSTRGYIESRGLYSSGGGVVPRQTDHAGREVTGYRGWVFQTDDRQLFREKGVGLTPDISRHFADAAIEVIARRSEKPFFLHVNFTAPHDPLLLPPGYEKKYDPQRLPLPANFRPRHPFDHGNYTGRDEQLFLWPRTPEETRAELAAYYAVISHLDEQIGRILKALEASGQADNTLIVFTSDHGLAVGSHGLRGKQNMYEHTIGVPLVLVGPNVPRSAKSEAPIYLRDLYPTICELAGVPIPASVEGRSLAPVLAGKVKSVHDAVFGYFRDTQRMVRAGRWKLIQYPRLPYEQLFDLQEDSAELTNRIDDPRHAAVRDELRARLRAWQKEVGDPLLAE